MTDEGNIGIGGNQIEKIIGLRTVLQQFYSRFYNVLLVEGSINQLNKKYYHVVLTQNSCKAISQKDECPF